MYHSEDLCEKSPQEMNTSVALLNLRRRSSESYGGSTPPPQQNVFKLCGKLYLKGGHSR